MNAGTQLDAGDGLGAVLWEAPAARAAAREIHTEACCGSLVQEWEDLAARAADCPFLRPGWMAAWWSAFGHGRLEVRTVRREGRLAAVLPLIRHHGRLSSATNEHTPRSGLLAEDWSAAVMLARSLFTPGTHRVSLALLASGNGALRACRHAAEEAGYRVMVRPRQRSPRLEISGDWQAYESGLSRNLRSDLRRSERRLARLGRVAIVVEDGRRHLDERLEQAFAVEASGWKGAHGTAIRSRADTRRFYRDIAHWSATRGSLRLFLLLLDGRPIAMFFAIEEDGSCHLLKGGYDPEYARYSPGKLLLRAVVARAFSERLSRVEFHGSAEHYKVRWANAHQQRNRFDAFSPSPMGRLAWTVVGRGWPAARAGVRALRGLRATLVPGS